MLQSFIIPGISLGLSASALPGPLHAFLINTTLMFGWRKGRWVVLSPLITDAPIIILMLFILGQLPDAALQVIRFIGGCLLLWIAWGAWGQYRAGVTLTAGDAAETDAQSIQDVTIISILGKAVLMNYFSPGPYLFWATVNGPLLLSALEISLLHAAAFLIAFYGTFLGMMGVVVFAFHKLGQMDQRVVRRVMLLTIALLVWFGTALIFEAFNLIDLHRVLAAVVIGAGSITYLWRRLRPADERSS